jgi:predicted component of type VI protein secretion system
VAVRDFNSKNGTLVNGERVVGQTPLKTGDKLSVGQLIFEVHASHDDPLQRRPKVKDVRDAAARIANSGPRDQDTDVTEWLMEDTAVSSSMDTKGGDLTKTQDFSASDIAQLERLKSSNGEPAAVVEVAAKTSDSKAVPASKKTPGKLPPVPVAATKDSREAAAEMLKKILRNR